MSPLQILKVTLQGAAMAIEFSEGFIPPGALLSVLKAADTAIRDVLSGLNLALKHEEEQGTAETYKAGFEQYRAALAKNPGVCGEAATAAQTAE